MEAAFCTAGCAVRPDGPDSHAIVVGPKPGSPVVRTAPPLPALASVQPKAAQSPQASALQRELQQAIRDAEQDLGATGNGYAWTVETVLGHLSGVLSRHLPGFRMDDYRFDREG